MQKINFNNNHHGKLKKAAVIEVVVNVAVVNVIFIIVFKHVFLASFFLFSLFIISTTSSIALRHPGCVIIKNTCFEANLIQTSREWLLHRCCSFPSLSFLTIIVVVPLNHRRCSSPSASSFLHRGLIHVTLVANDWAGAVMQKPLAIQKFYGPMDRWINVLTQQGVGDLKVKKVTHRQNIVVEGWVGA